MVGRLSYSISTQCPTTSGVFIAAGNALSSCPNPITLDTQMTLTLLQELLMVALRGRCLANRIGIMSNVKTRKGR